jgi:hypothetical protein
MLEWDKRDGSLAIWVSLAADLNGAFVRFITITIWVYGLRTRATLAKELFCWKSGQRTNVFPVPFRSKIQGKPRAEGKHY